MFSTYACSIVGRVDALDRERAALLAVEERAEDEARVGARPAHPLDRALLEECAVRAVTDDGEAVAHGGMRAIARTRRLYLPDPPRSKEGQLARHSGHHGLVIASNRLPIRLSMSDGSDRGAAELRRARGALAGRPRRRDLGRLARHGRSAGAAERASAQRLAQGQPRARCFSPREEEEDFYGRSATTRSGRSSTTSRTGCGSRPRRGRGTSR